MWIPVFASRGHNPRYTWRSREIKTHHDSGILLWYNRAVFWVPPIRTDKLRFADSQELTKDSCVFSTYLPLVVILGVATPDGSQVVSAGEGDYAVKTWRN